MDNSGTVNFKGPFQINGNAMTFPSATASLPAFNATDWTPVVAGSTVAGSNTYTRQIGKYAKFSITGVSVVLISFRVTLATLDGTASGNVLITGLPFPAQTATAMQYSISIWEANGTTLTAGYSQFTMAVQNGASYINLDQIGSGVGPSPIGIASITGTSSFTGSGWYLA